MQFSMNLPALKGGILDRMRIKKLAFPINPWYSKVNVHFLAGT
jgi:hypothetical protein